METLLSIKDYAMLTGISERHARRLAGNGQLQAQTVVNEKKRMEYRIPLSALPADAQKRYYAQQGIAVGAPPAKAAGKPFDHYTEAEREEIVWWEQKLAEWKKWRSRGGMSAAELDKRFLAYMKLEHPERELSIKTLYRKKKALETGNLDGLIDKRGQWRRGKTEIPDEVWRIYQSFLLQETKWQNIQDAIRLTEEYFQVNGPEYLPLASYSTFWRRTQEIPPQVRSLAIYGEKALKDDYTPYVRRRYQIIQNIEIEASNTGFAYLTDWDLGDLVDVVIPELGLAMEARIITVREVRKRNNLTITIELGDKMLTQLKKARLIY